MYPLIGRRQVTAGKGFFSVGEYGKTCHPPANEVVHRARGEHSKRLGGVILTAAPVVALVVTILGDAPTPRHIVEYLEVSAHIVVHHLIRTLMTFGIFVAQNT